MKLDIKSILGYKNVNRLLRLKYFPANAVCSLFPIRNTVILESNPDLADNTYQLYLYMIKMGLNKKMKIIWLVDEPSKYIGFPFNVFFEKKHPITRKEKIHKYFICNRSKAIVSCNNYIQKNVTNRRQVNIYLGHGALIKTVKDRNGFPDNCCADYITTQSEYFKKILADNFGLEEPQIICTGYPRDDVFYKSFDGENSIVPDISSFKKIVIWMPTFRKMANSNRIDCDYYFPLGVPLLKNTDELEELNKHLRDLNVLLLIKAHPAQDLTIVKNFDLDNIRFIPDVELRRQQIQTEELLTFTDALITDYSSVYYDYLLLNKPIAISLDDYEQYKSQHGLVFDDIKEIIKGVYLYNTKDLLTFLEDVAQGIDREVLSRNKARDLTNKYQDGKSSERVYNFLISLLEERGLID